MPVNKTKRKNPFRFTKPKAKSVNEILFHNKNKKLFRKIPRQTQKNNGRKFTFPKTAWNKTKNKDDSPSVIVKKVKKLLESIPARDAYLKTAKFAKLGGKPE